jgi:hypothetical protein
MKKLIFLFLFIPCLAFGQENRDVLYLKNGSIIKGSIIEFVPDQEIKIRTGDGSIFVFKSAEILKIEKEELQKQAEKPVTPAPSPAVQDKAETTTAEEYTLSRFALSADPLGFVFFGPIVNAEVRITERMAVNAHVRFVSLGVLAKVVKDEDGDLDELNGIAFGGGVKWFFGTKRSKPYIGVLGEYEKIDTYYNVREHYEWAEFDESGLLLFNGGYRIRTPFGLFINLGAMVGLVYTDYIWYNYDQTEIVEGGDWLPAYQLELAIGFEF